MGDSASIPMAGDFVEVRTRRWLVESVKAQDALVRARLACIDDDAQGETLEVLWRDEVDASIIADSHLSVFENPGLTTRQCFRPISVRSAGTQRPRPTKSCSRRHSALSCSYLYKSEG